MSLYGTMRTGVSGMNAQANRLSTVADNIANSSTVGYKKASTQFSSMILPSSNGSYNSGGVNTTVRYSINDQGSFTYTTSSTDLAINGEGFFIVSGSDGSNYLTRAGNFEVQPDGSLMNAAGFTLMGYPYSSTTDPTIVINGFDGLEEVNVQAGGMSSTPSTTGVVSGNLPSGEALNYEKSSSLVAYDSQGNSRLLDLKYTKTADNKWTLDVSYTDENDTLHNLGTYPLEFDA
ncbi:MAG: flagellar hook-basal body complex protein, partial [Agrobacterium vaccinii]